MSGSLAHAFPSERDCFSSWILEEASYQVFSSYVVSLDLQEKFQKIGKGKLFKSILINATLGIVFTGLLYVVGVSLKQSGYQFSSDVLFEYAKSEGVWIAIPVIVGVMLSAQTTLSTTYEILEKNFKLSIHTYRCRDECRVSSVLIAVGGISSYEFFVCDVSIFLTTISSLAIIGMIFFA